MPIDNKIEQAIDDIFSSHEGTAERIVKLLEDMQADRNIEPDTIFQRINLILDEVGEDI